MENKEREPAGPATVRKDWVYPEISRRQFCYATMAGAVAGAFSNTALTGVVHAAEAPANATRTLIKGGTVITMDRTLGDFDAADVLIEGSRITAVGRNLPATDAKIIPASNMIVMPGFIDTHRHMWQGQLRNCSAHGTEYLTYRDKCGPIYRPEDAYIGDTVSIWSALDAGLTTVLDWSHIQNTPAHTDAVIQALQDSGMRAVFAYGWPMPGSVPWWESKTTKFPFDIRRIRKQYFASEDQLLTLAMGVTSQNTTRSPLVHNPEQIRQEWAIAREVGARISIHIRGGGSIEPLAKVIHLAPDTTYVHCTGFSEDDFKVIADSGGTISLCPALDTLQARGVPRYREAMAAGLRPSLSADEEMDAPNDMFSQMRLALTQQRSASGVHEGKDGSNLLAARDVLEFATIEGAKANGLESITGSLSPGKQADIVLLRKDRINVAPVNNAVGAIVLGMDTGNVDSVFVAGKAKKSGGQLIGVDLKKVLDQAARSREYLLSKAGIPDDITT